MKIFIYFHEGRNQVSAWSEPQLNHGTLIQTCECEEASGQPITPKTNSRWFEIGDVFFANINNQFEVKMKRIQ